MKNAVLNFLINHIKAEGKYEEEKLMEIRYGLEAIYLNVSRFIVYFTINALLGTFLEGLIFLLFYIPLRSFSFGFHAKTSLTCWVISGIAFVGLPYISTLITFTDLVKYLFIIYFVVIYYLYSPADTPSRPIINKKLRLKLKLYTLLTVVLYCLIALFLKNSITNIILLTLFYQSVLITPFFYKLFKIQYNNFLTYGLN